MAGTIRINALNCNGLRTPHSDNTRIIAHTLKDQADIIFLLDTRLDPLTETNLSNHWHHKCLFAHNTFEPLRGIAILFNNDQYKPVSKIDDPKGRYTLIRLKIGTQNLLITAVYATAGSAAVAAKERRAFFNDLTVIIENNKQNDDMLILLGDFNMVEDATVDRYPPQADKKRITSIL